MKSEKKIKILRILFIISLIITIFCISTTYAKYYEEINISVQKYNIKRWIVNINQNDIYDIETLSNVVPLQLVQNEHMRDTKIVPGRECYFEILLNYSKVDVPFSINLTATPANHTEGEEYDYELKDFEMYGYSIYEKNAKPEDIKISNIQNTRNEETGSLNPMIVPQKNLDLLGEISDKMSKNLIIDPTLETDKTKEKILKVYFRWNDNDNDEISSMDDEADTVRAQERLTLEDGTIDEPKFEFNVNLAFQQYFESDSSDDKDTDIAPEM